MDYYSTLHLSSGFPLVIGLQHIENYKKIKVAEPTDHMMFKQDDGHEMHGMGVTHGYHHYIITTRPRCMFNRSSFSWIPSLKKVVGELDFEVGYRAWKSVPFEMLLDGSSPYHRRQGSPVPLPENIRDVQLAAGPMGHLNRVLIDTENERKGFYLEPDLLHFIRVDDRGWRGCLDFKVEYIGISTGKTGNRDFADRLWNHEKVREIAGMIQRDAPNLQVYVFGYQARYVVENPPGCLVMNTNILESELGIHEAAQVLEASLIGHFRPTYNDEFKDFPNGTRPKWLDALRRVIRPMYEPPGRELVSVVLASDNRHNPDGRWTLGQFHTDHTRGQQQSATHLCEFVIELPRKT